MRILASLALVLIGLSSVDAVADELVPFVGCPTEGSGFSAQEVPTGKPQSVKISHALAQRLAWYEDSGGVGVLAPRGWTCSAVYGSGGNNMQVRKPGQFTQVVAVRTATSEFSGRYDVARLLFQFFPKGHEHFIALALDGWKSTTGQDGAEHIKESRSATDQIRYRDSNTLDFVTPANRYGVGTLSKMPSPYRIVGRACVIEHGKEPEFTVLSVALPGDDQMTASTIVGNWDGCDL